MTITVDKNQETSYTIRDEIHPAITVCFARGRVIINEGLKEVRLEASFAARLAQIIQDEVRDSPKEEEAPTVFETSGEGGRTVIALRERTGSTSRHP